MSSRRIVVVGASEAGCQIALEAQAAGHQVTLVDEHPQAMKDMSFDAPWFYGAALPAALMNDNSIAQSVLEASPQLMECLEAGIDLRVSTILWGAFRNGPNCVHVGTPRVGLVTREDNEMLEHDALIITTGVRDFVPSFKGWELPGVLGGKAALALIDLYQVFEGERLLVLGSSELAMRVVRAALARGVTVTGVVEPGDSVVAGPEATQFLAEHNIPVHLGHVISEATGKTEVKGAKLVSLDGKESAEIACDTIAVAIATLPNIELPAAMGCRMRYEPALASWLPEISVQGETSLDGVFWLAAATGADEAMRSAILARIDGAAEDRRPAPLPEPAFNATDYIKRWIRALHETGGDDVILCQCETVSRAEFCGITPPRYLEKGLRHPQTPLVHSDDNSAPCLNQDFVKRMTRVSMGHCQGKRCRDEAAFTLSQRFGIGLETIRPASYRFPLRPIDLGLIADNDETDEIRLNWQMWPYETRQS
ncbi:FAD-dependent oxidoreductase [Daeguia caeni]|uniref:FAD-dependent oxidoreductase n=1 Tax=Daeguia caeni TaxID=439612 RepID=A0ABV9H6W8_9HYPH